MRTTPLFLALALVVNACQGESAAAPPPPSNVFISVANSDEGQRPPANFEGVWIDIVPGVEYHQKLVMGAGASEQRETRLNGHPFVVEGDYLVIGPKRYGPLPKGTRVEVGNEGVVADGKLLGPLPERIPMPPDGK